MTTILDRLNHELESFGRKAHAALDEGRFQIELMRLRRQRDSVACDLGRVIYKRERGKDIEQIRIDALMLRLDDIEAAIEKVERQMGSIRAEAYEAPSTEPVEATAPSAEAPFQGGEPASAAGVEEGSPS